MQIVSVLLLPSLFRCLFSLAQLLWLGLPNTMLNKSGESRHPCLIPDLRGKTFSFLPLSIMLTVILSYIAFVMLRYIPSIPSLLRIFIISGCWILSSAFSLYIEITTWFFTLHFVNMVVNINWFADVEPVLDSSNKSHLIMVYDPFNLLLNLVY